MIINMTEQEAHDFANWLRERAKRDMERADELQRMHSDNGAQRHQRVPGVPVRASDPVSQEMFEESVIKKSGRVYDLARRLGIDESQVLEFLAQPNARVAVAERGW